MAAYRGLSALFFCLALASSARGTKEGEAPDPAGLKRRAAELDLAADPQWIRLGHYMPRLFGGFVSEVDGSDFFLDPRGRRDPRAELDRSIEAFAAPASAEPDRSFACRYPARAKWLARRLGTAVPAADCPTFDTWFGVIGHDSVKLVFASYYVNNPASMFGHTFLRLDSNKPSDDHPLLSYSVNFAADTGDDNGLLFAFKGIVGTYPGRYTTYPYYLKVIEYTNGENRELWEYDLRLTDDEIDTLVRHLWEIGRTHSKYFFFDKNCSYQMLTLLEVARPTLDLRGGLSPFFVPPADTLKALGKYPGLADRPTWRSSVLRNVTARVAGLRSDQRRTVRRSLERADVGVLDEVADPAARARAADAAIEIMEYRNFSPQRTPYQKELLLARSGMPVTEALPTTPTDAAPDRGHESGRASIGGGTLGKNPFIEFQYRPVFHDLMSYDAAYPKLSEIIGMDLVGRYRVEEKKVDLERATFVQVFSLSPVRPFLWKPSWNVSFGFDTLYDDDCRHCRHAYFRIGSGLAASFFGDRLAAYALAGGTAQFAPWNGLGYRVAPLAESGLIFTPIPYYRARLFGTYTYGPFGDVTQTLEGALEQRVNLTKNLDLRLTGTLGQERREAKLVFGAYF